MVKQQKKLGARLKSGLPFFVSFPRDFTLYWLNEEIEKGTYSVTSDLPERSWYT